VEGGNEERHSGLEFVVLFEALFILWSSQGTDEESNPNNFDSPESKSDYDTSEIAVGGIGREREGHCASYGCGFARC
jgi:hypothetical protein